ncbi:MAG: hypothetical protein ACRDPF_26285 [Streptosporangiaceae bacterium]
MIAPAFYWDFGPSSAVNVMPASMICANLDRLELYVGGEHFAMDTRSFQPSDTVRLPGAPSRRKPQAR